MQLRSQRAIARRSEVSTERHKHVQHPQYAERLEQALNMGLQYRYIAAASLELSHINEVLVGVNYRFG